MSDFSVNADAEVERFELAGAPVLHDLPIRQDLFDLFGPGLVVLAATAPTETGTIDYDVWLHVGLKGRVTVCAGKAEVGQNVRTSIAQAAADEMRVPVESIFVIVADTERTPFDIGTFGSRSTPITIPQVRRAAATARETLAELTAGENRSIAGALARQRLVRIAGPETATTPADSWSVAGRGAPKIDAARFVTGTHAFVSDIWLGEMLHGKVLRPPAQGAVLRNVQIDAARAMPGVVVAHEDGFVGVAAPRPTLAQSALLSIQAEWDSPEARPENDLTTLLRPEPIQFLPAPASAVHRLQSTYTIAYVAHVPLEPRAAVARWDGDHLTVWTGTQRPFGVREELAVAFGLRDDQVRVIVPDTGSGYGGKHTGEAALEAARLSRAAGRPVKVAWTREEEFGHAYLRPGGVIDVSASIDSHNRLVEWQHHNYNSGGAAIGPPYNIPDQIAEFHEVSSPLRQGSYRALAATANAFARECHMDDLARAAGLDPLDFRLANLTDDRLRAVLDAAAERFGWRSRSKQTGIGYGLACGMEKGSFVANCVELVVDTAGSVRLTRIVSAFECGAIINPLHLENQVEGATVMGIGGALFEQIRFEGSRILNPRLSEYRVPRFGDVPPIDIVLLDRKDLPSVGAGETPIIAIAPAIRNAIADATGVRLRSMPLAPGGTVVAEV